MHEAHLIPNFGQLLKQLLWVWRKSCLYGTIKFDVAFPRFVFVDEADGAGSFGYRQPPIGAGRGDVQCFCEILAPYRSPFFPADPLHSFTSFDGWSKFSADAFNEHIVENQSSHCKISEAQLNAAGCARVLYLEGTDQRNRSAHLNKSRIVSAHANVLPRSFFCHPVEPLTLTDDALGRICAELKTYKRNLKQVRAIHELEKGTDELLDKHAREIERKAENWQSLSPLIAKDLKQFVKQIRGTQNGLRTRMQRHWDYGGIKRGLFEDLRDQAVPVQERELDSWFQLRLAAIFRQFLSQSEPSIRLEDGSDAGGHRNISLRTIARLIVLFLVCAGLAQASTGEIWLKHNLQSVSVDNVYDHLRRAGMDHKRKTGKR